MNTRLNVIISIEDENTCGRDCSFLADDECLLFSRRLAITVLPLDQHWNTGVTPTRQRDFRCVMMTED